MLQQEQAPKLSVVYLKNCGEFSADRAMKLAHTVLLDSKF